MQLHRLSALVLFLVAATANAVAQNDLAIDNFTTGLYQSPPYSSGTYSSTQKGGMLGGSRLTTIALCDFLVHCGSSNAYDHTSSYGIFAKNASHPASLEENAGYGTQSELNVEYGIGGELDANFSAYDRIRVNFNGLSGRIDLLALLETNGGIDSYAEDSCDLGYSDHPFSVEFPFDGFNASTGFDTAHVEALAFTFNGISKVGGVGYAVASIELSNSKAPGAIVCKVPEQSVQAR